MRVLLQSELYPPIVSGEGACTRSLAQGLAARGHAVRVLTASATGPATLERDGKVEVTRLRSVRNPAYATFRIGAWPIAAAARIVADHQPEVIHLHNPGPSAWALLFLGRRLGIPVVSTHHFLPTTAWRNHQALAPLARLVEGILWSAVLALHRRTDVVTAPSHFALGTLLARGLCTPARVISNGVDILRFNPGRRDPALRARLGVPLGAPLLLHVGRLYLSKAVDVLVAGLRAAATDAWLVVVGDGPARSDLERIAPGRVIFAGFLPDEALPALYATADAFAIASTAELQGIVVLEALASGTPVLAADAGALPELVRLGETGALFPPGDVSAFAARLPALLAAAPGLRSACRAMAERHGHDATTEAFLTLYNWGKCLNRHRRAPGLT